MILGWQRNDTNREEVRNKLVEAAWKSQNNRAFIFLMVLTGEINKHMGLHDLERSYKELLEMHGHMASSPDKHGNGAGVVANIHRGSGVIAIPQPADCPARDVTDEELEACTWKLSLQHMPAPVIKEIAQQLESPVLVSMLEAFRDRSSEVRKKRAKAIHYQERLQKRSEEGCRTGFVFMAGGEVWRRHL